MVMSSFVEVFGHGLLGELDKSLCDEVVVGFITCGGVLLVRGISSAAVRAVVVHDIKEEESERP